MNEYDEYSVDLDLTNAPPAQGRRQVAHVPKGPYLLRVVEAQRGQTSETSANGVQSKVTVRFEIAAGEYDGDEVEDMFAPFPAAQGETDRKKLFPSMRFHALLVALGRQPTTAKFRLDLKSLVGAMCIGNLDDNKMPASKDGKYAARTVSRPVSYEVLPDDLDAAVADMDAKQAASAARQDAREAQQETAYEPAIDATPLAASTFQAPAPPPEAGVTAATGAEVNSLFD